MQYLDKKSSNKTDSNVTMNGNEVVASDVPRWYLYCIVNCLSLSKRKNIEMNKEENKLSEKIETKRRSIKNKEKYSGLVDRSIGTAPLNKGRVEKKQPYIGDFLMLVGLIRNTLVKKNCTPNFVIILI